jgi:peptidyl-prolyl cis-trans isomerase D
MLDVIRRGRRWLTALFVVGIGGVFAVFIGVGSPLQPGGDSIITVGQHQIGIQEFLRTRQSTEQRYQDAFGDSFDADKFSDMINFNTAMELQQRAILALEAEEIGLTVAKEEVEREILTYAGLRDESGNFSREAYENWIYREFGSERLFREQQRRGVLSGKLARLLFRQAYVSEQEARDAVVGSLEEVKLAFPVLDGRGEEVERDEAAVAAFLASNEAEVVALYEKRRDQFDVPEQALARHILVQVPPEASDADVTELESLARSYRQRIVDGEDFAVLATEVSDDAGSATNGGSLGWFRRGQMTPEFDEAAFTLALGALSEPVKTTYGFHLIEVQERKAAEHKTLEQVQGDLAFELLEKETRRERVRALADQLAAAVHAGSTLESAARDAELTLERTDWLKRRPDGFVPRLGASPELLNAAFTLEPNESSDRVFTVGDKLTLIQVLERRKPDPDEVEPQVEVQRQLLEQQKRSTLIEDWINQRQATLTDNGELIVNLDSLN